jgi:hypothetical protein
MQLHFMRRRQNPFSGFYTRPDLILQAMSTVRREIMEFKPGRLSWSGERVGPGNYTFTLNLGGNLKTGVLKP